MRPGIRCSADGRRVFLMSTFSRNPESKNALHKVNHAKHKLFPSRRIGRAEALVDVTLARIPYGLAFFPDYK